MGILNAESSLKMEIFTPDNLFKQVGVSSKIIGNILTWKCFENVINILQNVLKKSLLTIMINFIDTKIFCNKICELQQLKIILTNEIFQIFMKNLKKNIVIYKI